MYTVYLGGPISGLAYDDCTNWRDYFEKCLRPFGIISLNPLRYMEHLKTEMEIKHTYDKYLTGTAKAIFVQDVFDVRRADLVIANFLGAKKVSIGTVTELGIAHENKKPVITVMEEDNIHNHPFVREISTVIVKTYEDAIAVTKSILLPVT